MVPKLVKKTSEKQLQDHSKGMSQRPLTGPLYEEKGDKSAFF